MFRVLYILVLLLLLQVSPAIAQLKEYNDYKSYSPFYDVFIKTPYWVTVKHYEKCVIKDGEIIDVFKKGITPARIIYHFEGKNRTMYKPDKTDKFAHAKFNVQVYRKNSATKWSITKMKMLKNGNIALFGQDWFIRRASKTNEYEDVVVLTPLTEEQFRKALSPDPVTPTLEEYFSEAKRVPRNLKKVLREKECWQEYCEACKVEDGVVKVLGKDGSKPSTIRRFTKGYEGDYFTYSDEEWKVYQMGKFSLNRRDFLYSLGEDIIYLPRESLSSNDTIYYYKLHPSTADYETWWQMYQKPKHKPSRKVSKPSPPSHLQKRTINNFIMGKH